MHLNWHANIMAKTMAVIAIKQKLFVWKITFWLFFDFVMDVKSAHSKSQFIQAHSSIIIHHTLIHCETNWINWFGRLFFLCTKGDLTGPHGKL